MAEPTRELPPPAAVPSGGAVPQVLARGGYAVLLTANGGGFSSFEGSALTRWSADTTRDADGFFVYLRDLESGTLWSAGHQPVGRPAERYQASLTGGRGRIVRVDGEIETECEVILAPEGEAELRRLTLRNGGASERRIEVTTFAELVLDQAAAHAGHPAFSRLFVQTAWDARQQALLAWRRLRGPDDAHLWVVHRLLADDARAPEYETDRARFIGRGRTLATPAALGAPLSGTSGDVLDPAFSLRRVVTVPPGGSVRLCLLLGAARSREGARAVLARYPVLASTDAAFAGDADGAGGTLTDLGLPAEWTRYAAEITGPAPGGTDRYRPVTTVPAGGDGGEFEAEELLHFNSFGGFAQDGREYVIRRLATAEGPRSPPLPWVNVIANEQAGFLVSESGAGNCWALNSRLNRLTPWLNDAVSDPHGDALYLRDEDSGLFWSPTPGPVPGAGAYETRHGFGYTRWRHHGHGLEQDCWMFVPRHDPVRIIRLRLRNPGERTRSVSAYAYLQWVLGGLPQETRATIHTRHLPELGAVLAVNPERGEFSARVAFAAAVGAGAAGASATADRLAFMGRCGSVERPRALLQDERLDGAAGAGLDPCAAFQRPLTLAPGGSAEVVFLLGEAEDEATARRLLECYATVEAASAALDEVRAFWDDMVGQIQVATPSPELDLMVNGWLTYQNLSCRMWGRTAFYQSGGAFGFRDQLQDSSALVYLRPELTRAQIVLHAGHQFVEGDVLHWWHPPLSAGIRTRFADDLLWLPYVTAFYLAATGDRAVLDESAPLLAAPPLPAGSDEVYLQPTHSGEAASVFEHCCRSLDRSLTRGAHGLPLIGTGDWNDGMNRVGREGRGESVWLGFFLHSILGDFIPLCAARGEQARGERYAAYRSELGEALNQGGWDGGWYRRAYYDNGEPIGSASSEECRIDAIAQGWAVLSRVAPAERARQALDALEQHLVSERDGIIRLLTPPFDRTPQDPGYIKGYLPGVRENGGQYTHGVLWAVRALAEAGRTERAAPLLAMLSPVSHGRTRAEVEVYRTEPYVVAADVYGHPPHVGRGGWTWYTGSAGWMFRVALESVLGITLAGGDTLRVRPCIPRGWPGFEVRYRLPDGLTRYQITLTREPGGGIRGELDGAALDAVDGVLHVPLRGDGRVHEVSVVLGREAAPVYRPEAS
ncbi:MAG TPA: hypothetical protein VEW03_09465 [Longimicrobiaceae bacterium]|nr:hypothetical protein [Longimicrobiaceae bacterium]